MVAKTGNKNTDDQNSFINDNSGNVARNVVSGGSSSVVYSDYQASLSNGAELDSGWLDMNGADKVQFSGYASLPGMTMTIMSRAHDDQPSIDTPVIYSEGTFYLFNVICRQRYMRFRWSNNTGSTVSDASIEVKQSFGSSDKLSVFPVSVTPSIFSQAGLVQAILRGLDQDGNYTNVGTNEVGALNISNFLVDVARGKYPNYILDTKFGRNSDVDTGTPEDIWNGDGSYTGFNAIANENLETFSSSANDIGSLLSSGTATSGTSSTMIDTGATFITDGVAVGDILINDTQQFHGIIKSLTETQLTVNRFNDGEVESFTFASGDSYRVATASGTGAAVVKWENILDEDYAQVGSAYVIMNGITGVTYSINAMRCSRGKVILAGSLGLNDGNITLRQAVTTANVFALIPSGAGQTSICCDTVPAGKTRIITNFTVAMGRLSGAIGSANMQFQVRHEGESWQTKRFPTITNSITYSPNKNPNLIVIEKSDMRWRADSVSDNNTIISAEFEYLEIDNTVF